MFQLLPLPLSEDWERVDSDWMESTVAWFRGGYESEQIGIRIWCGTMEPFAIDAGVLYTIHDSKYPESPEYESEGWIFENDPDYYLAYENRYCVEIVDKLRSEVIKFGRVTNKAAAADVAWKSLPESARTRSG